MKLSAQTRLAVSILLGSPVISVDAAYADDPAVQWLKEHAVPLRTIDPADEDFSDLKPLKETLAEARIVQLGEQSHGDGATFHAKTRLVKFLHREMGFDVLAFESGLYDCDRAWRRIEAGVDADTACAMAIFPIWTASAEVRPLLDYLGAAARTDRPLELCGFDCQFSGSNSREHFVAELNQFLDGRTPEIDPAERQALSSFVTSLVDGAAAPDEVRRKEWERAVKSVSAALIPDGADPAKIDPDADFWRQVIESTWAFAQLTWASQGGRQDRTMAERFNPRDAQMARNLLWLATQRYPDRKTIVWAATMHLARSPHMIETGDPDLDYAGVEPMGHLVSQALGKKVYTIGFTAYDGAAGVAGAEPWTLQPVTEGTFEHLCAQADLKNAFIDFRHVEEDSPLREPLVARPLGYQPMTARWPQILDGMIFTRTMYPSTRGPKIYSEEEKARAGSFVGGLREAWQRARARLQAGQPYADKVTFIADYERWVDLVSPTPEAIASTEQRIERWLAEEDNPPDLAWRCFSLLARMVHDRGETDRAMQCIDRALALYPPKDYAIPSKHSFFQHLVNQKAMMLWDAEGLEAAIDFARRLLATDERFHYFFAHPWRERLRAAGRAGDFKSVVEAILTAYEQRAARFPEHVDTATRHAYELEHSH